MPDIPLMSGPSILHFLIQLIFLTYIFMSLAIVTHISTSLATITLSPSLAIIARHLIIFIFLVYISMNFVFNYLTGLGVQISLT